MVEPARRHGPFDIRYPLRRKRAARNWELQPDEDRLELGWSAFRTRFFPNRRRHDFEALAAYDSYRNALEQASAAAGTVTQPAYTRRRRAEASELSAAVLVWEWEGGAVTERVAG